MKRSIVIVTYLAILTRSAIAAGIPESETIYFESSGHQVAVDLVRPAVSGRHPAILLLHGGSGMSFYRASFARRAQKLAGAGFSVLTPHYFDASASPDGPEITEARFRDLAQGIGRCAGLRGETSGY